jgi:hypothetical protein
MRGLRGSTASINMSIIGMVCNERWIFVAEELRVKETEREGRRW